MSETGAELIHILCVESWYEQAQRDGQFVTPSLESEGFIHASPAHQLNRVANLYYADAPSLLLLSVQPALLQFELKWEPASTGDLYPHIYGPLNLNAIVKVTPFERSADGRFDIQVS